MSFVFAIKRGRLIETDTANTRTASVASGSGMMVLTPWKPMQ